MHISSGTFLISTSTMDDPNFFRSKLFITQYDNNGATGFIIDQLHPRKLNELAEFISSPPFPLHIGGPVEKEQLFFIHQRPDLIDDGILIKESVYLGGNFKQAVMHINNNSLRENDIRLFIGYCGWDAGELEMEVEEGSWRVSDEGIIVFI